MGCIIIVDAQIILPIIALFWLSIGYIIIMLLIIYEKTIKLQYFVKKGAGVPKLGKL